MMLVVGGGGSGDGDDGDDDDDDDNDGDDDDDDIEERKGMFVISVLKSIYTIIVRSKTSLYFSLTRAQYPTALMTRFSKPVPNKETTRRWLASQPLMTSGSRKRTLSSSPLLLLLNHSSTSASLQLSFEYL